MGKQSGRLSEVSVALHSRYRESLKEKENTSKAMLVGLSCWCVVLRLGAAGGRSLPLRARPSEVSSVSPGRTARQVKCWA